MLKLFFDRFSKVVYAMEILGVLFTLAWLYKLAQHPPSFLTRFLICTVIGQYLLLRLCATRRWHKNARRYEGLELHFKKILIPTSYILAITSGLGFWAGLHFMLWPAILLMSVFLYVNFTLIYLHFRDKNKTPVNYYSRNK